MALRNILTDGEPTLMKTARPVTRFDHRLHDLLDDLADTMEEANGVGLAAPQVGVLRRVAVVCDGAGRAVYSDCGYRVGSAELLLKVAAWVCGEKKRGRYLDR